MIKVIRFHFLLVLFTADHFLIAQCNLGLNLGAVIVPTHGDSANGGNFFNVPAWQEAASWVDTFNLDYRQRYLTWTDVVQQVNGGIPTYNNYSAFENGLTSWSGNCAVHIVYPVIKVELPNTLLPAPPGFNSLVSDSDPAYFSDTSFVNQNYLAIKHILQNVGNVKWISIGNEIDTYFKNAYWGTGRLTRYTAFLDTIRNRMDADGYSNVLLGSVVAFHNLTWSGNFDIIDSIRSHLDFVGYTFYYTNAGPPNDTCWGNPVTVSSWLNTAKAEVGNKGMMLTETCMGDGGGFLENCGSPIKQLEYADTLLNWYALDTSQIIGMTWFTIVDPYLGWQTPNTLWNTCGLVDSNGMTVQMAGTLWRHDCTSGLSEIDERNSLRIFPNPTNGLFTVNTNGNLQIYNVLGDMIFETHALTGTTNIDLSDQTKGCYFIIIRQENTSHVQKIILQ